jgi:hypothetical protein
MTLPDNFRSLFACGAFCVVGGAWLALATGIRTVPLREELAVSPAPTCTNGGSSSPSTPDRCAAPSP